MTKFDSSPKGQHPPSAELVGKAIAIFELVRSHQQGLPLDQIVKLSSLPRDTVVLLTDELRSNRLLRFETRNQAFFLSYEVLERMQDVVRSANLIGASLIEVSRLRDETGESAFMTVDEGTHAVIQTRALSGHDTRAAAMLGAFLPLHSSASGKVILAFSPEERSKTLFSKALRQVTPATKTAPTALNEDLSLTRRRGFALSDEEHLLGERSIAAAVRNGNGDVVGSIAVAGPSFRISNDRIESIGQEVIASAARVTADLRQFHLSPQKPKAVWQISEEALETGASPQWHAGRNSFFWVNRKTGTLFEFDKDEHTRVFRQMDTAVDDLILTPEGQFILQQQERLNNLGTGRTIALDQPPIALSVGAKGDLWAVMKYQQNALLLNVLPDGRIVEHSVLPADSSDLVFCPRTHTAFVICSDSATLLSYQSANRQLRQISSLSKASGKPKVLTMDPAGHLWVGLENGWALAMLSRDGHMLGRMTLPVPTATGLSFGGANRHCLVLTSQTQDVLRDILHNAPQTGHTLKLILN